MANHRGLARELYETSLGRTSASRIWRTVVFAGAMLGAPLAAAQTPAPNAPASKAQPKVPPPPQAAGAPVTTPPPKPDPNALKIADAQKKIGDLETQRKDLAAKVVSAEISVADLQKARSDLAAKDRAILAAIDDLIKIRKPPPRPRATDDRPVGRGFVLA